MEKGNIQDLLSSSNLSTASQQHPAAIARTVLYLQQLPPEFDISRLKIGPSLEKILDQYLSAVDR
jgi:NADP-dependent 3-hydroxy acid dehydrogenase YdfG